MSAAAISERAPLSENSRQGVATSAHTSHRASTRSKRGTALRNRPRLRRNGIGRRYPGQYFDAETGLHYNWHRYYAPELGRYLQPDPLGLAGGDTNLYGYVLNDPINLKDPSGLFFVPGAIAGGVIGAVVGGAGAAIGGADAYGIAAGAAAGLAGGIIGGGLGVYPGIGAAIGAGFGAFGNAVTGGNPGSIAGGAIGGGLGGAVGGLPGPGATATAAIGTYCGGVAATAYGMAGQVIYDLLPDTTIGSPGVGPYSPPGTAPAPAHF